MNKTYIAPCGMNCAICIGMMREKNKCPGCNFMGPGKPGYCRKCVIRNCPVIKKSKAAGFCFVCDNFPCKRLRNLDKRYRSKYNMSMIENLLYIKKEGVRKLLKREEKKWKCRKCGATLSCHRQACLKCGGVEAWRRRRVAG